MHSIRTARPKQRQGQALVEFALVLPVALFLIFGIIDFGRLFIAFTSASGALRTAARYSATVGQVGTPRYMDCAAMRDAVSQAYFVDRQTIAIRHVRASDGLPLSINCINLTENKLHNGDYIIIDSRNTVRLITPLINSIWPQIRLNFTAQRTIVKQIPLLASAEDTEPDGLNDLWEIMHFGDITLYSATDDPDGDGCNNGCEEYFFIEPAAAGNPPFSLDPNNPDSDGDGLSDGDEIFIYGTDPQVPDTDGDGVDDGTEIAMGTNPLAFEPMANDDGAVVNAFSSVSIPVLANDDVEVPEEIYIVTFDSTSLHGGTITMNDNGTPAVLHDDQLTFAPRVGFLNGRDEFTYTITDSSGITSTATVFVDVLESAAINTPVPTAIPPDTIHTAPVPAPQLDGDLAYWRMDRGPVFLGYDAWEVKWWSHGGTPQSARDVMANPALCTTTQPFDTPLAFNWGANAPSQCSSVSAENFSVQWQRTFGFGVAADPPVSVTFTAQADDAIQILLDDGSGPVSVIDHWSAAGVYNESRTVSLNSGTEYTLTVRYAEFTGNAQVAVNMHDGTNDDYGVCGWALDASDGFPAAPGFTDYPNRDYAPASRCSLELRGAVDMNGLPNPEISFYDRFALFDGNDTAWLLVRDYNGTTPWYGHRVHAGLASEPTWTRRAFDLDSFQYDATFDGGIQTNTSGTVNFTDDTIEFRFTIIGGNDNGVAYGWWIDEIRVEEGTPDIFGISWSDTMEYGPANWLPQGTWIINSQRTYGGSANAWSDSPGGSYMPGANNILELDAEIDVTTAADPLLIFYHSWELGSGDNIYVEYTTDSGGTWNPITGGPLVTTGTTNTAMVRQEVSLNSIKATRFGLRFRLQADNDGSQANGWFIDNIELAERDNTPLVVTTAAPFIDNANDAIPENWHWYPDGTWIPSSEAYRGTAGTAWNDSPAGNYTHLSSSSLRSRKQFDISGLPQPELSFWHRRDLAAGDGLFVEISTDNGSTWTPIWSRQHCASGSTTEVAPDSNGNPVSCTLFNQQLGWERISINMGAYTAAPFHLRFRMDAMTDAAVAGGAWIDDIRLANYTETVHTIQPDRFFDGMEDGSNWYLGGSWDMTLAESHAGAASLTDSPNTDYATGTWSVLELRHPISLAGIAASDNPTLFWWDRYALEEHDYARVQVSVWGEGSWSNWGAWQEMTQYYMEANTAWNRHSVDLSAFAGEKIRLRFILDALNLADVADGWYIDNVSVELYDPTIYTITPIPFAENADSLTGWLPGGTWNNGLGIGTGITGLGAETDAWTATFYDLDTCLPTESTAVRAENAITGACSVPTTSVTLDDVQFLCGVGQTPDPNAAGTCSAAPWKADYLAIRFVRTFQVDESSQHRADITFNDGARLYVYPASETRGAPLLDRWADTPTTDGATTEWPLAAGNHIIELWYYEATGESSIALDISRPSMAFYALTENTHDDMLLTLDGLIDLDGITAPAMTWHERYNLANTFSCARVEVSLPNYRPDHWVTAYNLCGTAASGSTWQARSVPNLRTALETIEDVANYGTLNISGDNALMGLRFRLFGDTAGSEWQVESISIAP